MSLTVFSFLLFFYYLLQHRSNSFLTFIFIIVLYHLSFTHLPSFHLHSFISLHSQTPNFALPLPLHFSSHLPHSLSPSLHFLSPRHLTPSTTITTNILPNSKVIPTTGSLRTNYCNRFTMASTNLLTLTQIALE